MNYLKIINETISDGLGFRMSIYLSGCIHNCKGCHNKDSWNPKHGINLNEKIIKNIIKTYKSNPLLDGITFTGGDPLYNIEEFTTLIKKIKRELNCNIWVYTGYIFEEVKDLDLINYIDILVDGKFIIEKYNPTLQFRGSSNQRIIDIKKSLATNEVVKLID